jgi:hypothetical protein
MANKEHHIRPEVRLGFGRLLDAAMKEAGLDDEAVGSELDRSAQSIRNLRKARASVSLDIAAEVYAIRKISATKQGRRLGRALALLSVAA